jgi:hypothetical protein
MSSNIDIVEPASRYEITFDPPSQAYRSPYLASSRVTCQTKGSGLRGKTGSKTLAELYTTSELCLTKTDSGSQCNCVNR